MHTVQDRKGNTLLVDDRVITENGKEGYVLSVHTKTNKVRVKFASNMIRKFEGHKLTRG